jgi:hypothetical protein
MGGIERAFVSLAVASFIALVGQFGGASDDVATKKYQVLILTPEGHILDQHTLTCADDDEATETARVLADSNPVEVWNGPVRIVRFEQMQ